MADDRMKNDDQQRNMGAGGSDKQDFGQQSPGRSGQQGGYGGSQQGGQQAGQHGQQGQHSGQKGSQGMEDDEFATGGQKQSGGQNR
jgi:hypothetical protein